MKGNKLIDMESRGIGAVAGQESKWWTQRLAGPVIAAAVVRLALLIFIIARSGVSVLTQPDTGTYLQPGRNLLLHGSFVADGVPDLLRTPGYPIFLALFSLAGPVAAALANVILSVFSVLLVWRLARTVFDDERVALGAAWIFAFELISVVSSVVLMSETLFVVLFLLSMGQLAQFLHSRQLRAIVAAGLWLAAATFVRPFSYYLAIALALGLFVVLARLPGLRWKAPAVLLLSVLPWLAVWQLRNKVETGYGGFTSAADLFFYFFVAPEVTAKVENKHFADVRKDLGYVEFANHNGQDYLYQPYLAAHPEQVGWNQAQRLAYMHSEANRVLRAHPGIYLRSCFTGLVKVVFDPGTTFLDRLLSKPDPAQHPGDLQDKGVVRWGIALVKSHPWLMVERAAFGLVLLGLYFFAARGVVHGGMQTSCLLLLLGTSLYFFAVSATVGLNGAEVRYRLSVMPFVCIFAAAGFLRAKHVARPVAG